jgi:hypothetical protein
MIEAGREAVQFVVEQSRPDTRLDAYLRERLVDVSRGAIQRLIESGHIRVNGRHAKVTQAPRAGDCIEVLWPEPEPAEARPQAMALEVLMEDEDVIVLNKPPGLVVHPSAGHAEGTVVNALLHHCEGQLSGIGGVARPGIVHRLDKDTSGCAESRIQKQRALGLGAEVGGRAGRGDRTPDRAADGLDLPGFSGATHIIFFAVQRAGTVRVRAYGGTASRRGEVAFLDLLHFAGVVELHEFDRVRVVEAGDWRVVEGDVTVFADAQAAEVDGLGLEQGGVAGDFVEWLFASPSR